MKGFGNCYGTLAKIQIDNNFGLSWKKKDILLATNSIYRYDGTNYID